MQNSKVSYLHAIVILAMTGVFLLGVASVLVTWIGLGAGGRLLVLPTMTAALAAISLVAKYLQIKGREGLG